MFKGNKVGYVGISIGILILLLGVYLKFRYPSEPYMWNAFAIGAGSLIGGIYRYFYDKQNSNDEK